MEQRTYNFKHTNQLVLSICPGGDLLGRPFQEKGFCVVRGPDAIHGGDTRHFLNVPRGAFNGLIGGPPCQEFSQARPDNTEATSVNLIPYFLQLREHLQPQWAIMENVVQAQVAVPDDIDYVTLRDWDCGGRTNRIRRFWFWGIPAPPPPAERPGQSQHSVLATNWKHRNHRDSVHSGLKYNQASMLQGFDNWGIEMHSMLPDCLSDGSKNNFVVHMMGNGVPRAMGEYLADWVLQFV